MYSKNDLKKFEQKRLLCRILFFASIFCFIATFIISLCFTNYKNYRYFEVIGGVCCAIFVFLTIFFFFKGLDYQRMVNHYTSVFHEEITYFDGVLISINEHVITLDDNIRVKELSFEINNDKKTFYLLAIFDTNELKIGNKYNVSLSDRFVRSFNHEI